MWNGRRYHSLDYYLKTTFGEKLYKLSLDGGMTCPNRDGTLSTGGCIFCSEEGSGDFAAVCTASIDEQFQHARELIAEKYSGSRFIAYFQSFTNTYAPTEQLEKLFTPVIHRKEIAVLDIATRPDCLEEDKIPLLAELNRIKPVWVELGLQTSNDLTAKFINRGYPTAVYADTVKRLHAAGITVITHMIIGLPHETREDILTTARYIAVCGSDGIKLHLLHILEGTKLSELYLQGKVHALTEEEYISLICDIIAVLPESMVIHRLTGDGDRKKLLAPRWSCDKRHILNRINHQLKQENVIQGSALLSDHE